MDECEGALDADTPGVAEGFRGVYVPARDALIAKEPVRGGEGDSEQDEEGGPVGDCRLGVAVLLGATGVTLRSAEKLALLVAERVGIGLAEGIFGEAVGGRIECVALEEAVPTPFVTVGFAGERDCVALAVGGVTEGVFMGLSEAARDGEADGVLEPNGVELTLCRTEDVEETLTCRLPDKTDVALAVEEAVSPPGGEGVFVGEVDADTLKNGEKEPPREAVPDDVPKTVNVEVAQGVWEEMGVAESVAQPTVPEALCVSERGVLTDERGEAVALTPRLPERVPVEQAVGVPMATVCVTVKVGEKVPPLVDVGVPEEVPRGSLAVVLTVGLLNEEADSVAPALAVGGGDSVERGVAELLSDAMGVRDAKGERVSVTCEVRLPVGVEESEPAAGVAVAPPCGEALEAALEVVEAVLPAPTDAVC